MLRLLLLFTGVFIAANVFAEKPQPPPSLTLAEATGPIVIDGKIDEAAWQNAVPLHDFIRQFPVDSGFASMQTSVRILHDEKFLYVSAVCYQHKYVVTSLRRDFPFSSSDIFILTVDPFQDKLNGFYFAVTPYGVQKEALISNGNDRNADWDNVWYSEATRDAEKYTVEMAIPFKTLRYRVTDDRPMAWNMNFIRNNLETNERSSWAPVPINQSITDMAFCGEVKWEKAPPKPGGNVTLIPYALGSFSRDYVAATPGETGVNAGGDAKIGITPSLNLDLTINPDFAQVEVDRQVTNLSRFELFFPERRQFFLENSDLFGSFGFSNANPFFSRRIGLGRNVSNGQNVQIPIWFGARLSGRINKDWRIGVMNVTTGKSEKFDLAAANYMVATAQRRIGKRNNLSAIMVSRDELNGEKAETRYNRVAGVDYNFASAGSELQGKVFYHQGFTPEKNAGQYAAGATAQYRTNQWNMEGRLMDLGKSYNPAVGFSPRANITRGSGNIFKVVYTQPAKQSAINNWYAGPDFDIYYGKGERRLLDWDAGLFFGVNFQNGAGIQGAALRWDYTYLFNDFDPTNTNAAKLPANTSYRYFSNRLSFNTNPRRTFYAVVSSRFGKYFNGNITQIQTQTNLRIQPYATLTLDVNYTGIKLPKPYGTADIWLIGPRADITFNRQLFFTGFFQYNTQINNVNINARLQYRFRPVSDIYLVYTDNYFASSEYDDNRVEIATPWQPKYKAIVLKATYWLNL